MPLKQFTIVFSITLIILFYLVAVNPFWGKFLVSSYDGFTVHHISTIVTKEAKNQILKQEALLKYIYQNVTHEINTNIYPITDHPPIDLLIRGIGACDQVADLFTDFLKLLDLRGFGLVLTKLKEDKWTSPHTVAVIVPRSMSEDAYRAMHPPYPSFLKIQPNVKNQPPSMGRKIGGVVDPLFGILYKNIKNQPATIDDICTRNIISSQIKFLDIHNKFFGSELYCNPVNIWWAKTPISEHRKWRQWAYKHIYPILPIWAIHLYQDLVLAKGYGHLYEGTSFAFFKARNYQLYERFDESIENYDQVIAKTPDKEILSASIFWKGMIYFRKKEFVKSKNMFESIKNNYPKSGFAIGADKWLSRIALNREAFSNSHTEPVPFYEVDFNIFREG